MKFKVLAKSGEEKIIDFVPKHIINAGYTGRDQAAVQAHIDELKEEGIPAPDKTPVYFVNLSIKLRSQEALKSLTRLTILERRNSPYFLTKTKYM